MNKECLDHRSMVFLQYSCMDDDISMHQKWNDLSIVTGCVSFIGFIWIGFTIYVGKKIEIIEARSDFIVTSADDYTVELDLGDG
jgi:hypothetical protein